MSFWCANNWPTSYCKLTTKLDGWRAKWATTFILDSGHEGTTLFFPKSIHPCSSFSSIYSVRLQKQIISSAEAVFGSKIYLQTDLTWQIEGTQDDVSNDEDESPLWIVLGIFISKSFN